MMRGARTTRRGAFAMIARALVEFVLRQRDDGAADLAQHRIGHHRGRIGRDDAGIAQRFARQIKPPEPGILVEVAQDIGELQRAAEMMGEREARFALHAEHPHRQPPHRAGDAIAIKIERGAIGRADIGDDVHLHAGDDGEKVAVIEIESAHRLRQTRKLRRRRTGIKRGEIGPPLVERRAPPVARARDRRRCRRRRGRTNRFRTSPRAARAAESASRNRTKSPTRARRPEKDCSLTPLAAFATRRKICGRAGARCRARRRATSGRRRPARQDARARSADRGVIRMRVSRCAKVLMTETSRRAACR